MTDRLDVFRRSNQPFREEKARGEVIVIARRAHRDGDIFLVTFPGDADLQRLFDGEDVFVPGHRPRGDPRDRNRCNPLLRHALIV